MYNNTLVSVLKFISMYETSIICVIQLLPQQVDICEAWSLSEHKSECLKTGISSMLGTSNLCWPIQSLLLPYHAPPQLLSLEHTEISDWVILYNILKTHIIRNIIEILSCNHEDTI